MSTNINIKKKIGVQEESVTITTDLNNINFVGGGVSANSIGDDVTVNIQGSIGATSYYLNQTINQAPYKEFSSFPTSAVEQVLPATVSSGGSAIVQSFQTPSGVPNTTNIPAGLWQFYLHFSGTAGNSWNVFAEVYKRDLGGTETLLLTTDAIPTTTLTATPTMLLTDGVFPATTLLTTDRIVIKIKVTNTGGGSQTINFHTEGATNYSVGTTTLNQIVPAGAVTSVTGTAPIVSSGGTTPAISIPQANGTTDGFLDSADWTVFNNKPDNLSQLNDVDVTTLTPSDGEVLTYDGVSGLWKNEAPNSTPTNQVVLFADLATTEALKACTYNNGTLGVGATLTGIANGQLATVSFTDRIDNVVTALGQIILVKNQPITSNPLTNRGFQNGLYIVTQLGSPTQPFIITRTTDADTQAELYPLQVNVFGGQTQANLAYLQKTIDPIVGTNNVVFTTTVLGIQNTPVLHVDTATSAPLPACTYTSGTNPTLPGQGAFLEADVNGTLPAINGVTLTAGRRFLIKDQANQAHNGTYTVSSVGSASTRWRLIRVDAWGSNFTVLDREWKVNNPASTKYGARYSTNLLGLANTAIGTTNIVFTELTDNTIYNSDGTLAGNRTVTMAGNTLNFTGGNVGLNTSPTQRLDVNGVTRHRGNVLMDPGTTLLWEDTTGVLPTSVNSKIRWTINSDSAEIYAFSPAVTTDDIDFVFKISDNATTVLDNYVFWIDDFAGEASDSYPLEMRGLDFIVNPLRRYATLPANQAAGATNFNVLKLGATNLTGTILHANVTTERVGINTSSPSETLDVNGKTKTTTFQMTTTPTAGYVLTSDASGNGSWQANGNGTVTSVGLTAGTGITLGGTNPITSSGSITVTNSAPDQTVVLTPSTGISVTGAYPNFTIVNTAPDQTVVLNAGTGIGVTGTYPNFTIDNTSPSSSGKIGIADSNGAFTYYSTLSSACAAALSGQTITLFTDVTETTATAAALPDGVDLNLNGNSYILDVAGATNAVETAGGGTRNNIYNGKIIRRNVGGSSVLIGVCLRNRTVELNMYGVQLINEDDCTALLIEESGTVNGSWSARCDGPSASGVTVNSGYNPFIYNGTITSGGVGVYVGTGSSVTIYDSFIQSGNEAITSAGDVSVYNSIVLASATTGIEITSGTLILDRSFVFASSGGAISVSSGTMNISLSRIGSVGANAISLGTITSNIEIIESHITTLNGTNNFSIENLQAYKVDISNNYFFIQGTGTRRNLAFANTSDAGNASIDVKNNTLEVVSSGISGSSSNIYFRNYLSGFYKLSGNEFKCQSASAAARCIRTNGFPLTMAYISNVLKLTNGQNPIDANITQGNGFTPDLYGNIQTDY